MQKQPFSNEEELHSWISQNVSKFLGNGLFINGNFFIYTKRNKGAKPDGYYINFETKKWTIIETELLSHGVWPHIAEQITRFSIASKNSETLRNLRDKFFNEIEKSNQIEIICEKLNIKPERLIKRIENIIESDNPNIAIFIDEINEDLADLAESLNSPISIYRVQKFVINNQTEYFSDDYNHAVIQTTIEEIIEDRLSPNQLSITKNSQIFYRNGKVKFYQNDIFEKYFIKYSRQYENGGYWFGITPQLLEQAKQQNLTNVILQLGNESYVNLPIEIITNYTKNANSSYKKETRETLHYHIHINRNPELELISRIGKNRQIGDYEIMNEI